jgi:hypothetical protein
MSSSRGWKEFGESGTGGFLSLKQGEKWGRMGAWMHCRWQRGSPDGVAAAGGDMKIREGSRV